MKNFLEFSKTQMKTLTLLGIVVLVAGSYTLIRDYSVSPSGSPRTITEQEQDDYRPPLILDLNHSPADSLELIPGIGPVLAERIIEYRRIHGNFESIDSLVNVAGIGPVTLSKIRKYVKADHR